MQLNELSADCLSSIVSFLDCHQLISLWMTGDCVLKVKLARGVRVFDWQIRPWLPVTWPRILYSFDNLAHLRIGADTQKVYLAIPSFRWNRVPSSVTSLSLSIQFRGPQERIPPYGLDAVMMHLKSLDLQFSTSGYAYSAYPDFGKWMPALERLKLRTRDNYPISLHLLPTTLTDLDAEALSVIPTEKTYEWPSGLTRLHLKLAGSKDISSLVSSLPSTLTNLGLSFSCAAPEYGTFDWSFSHLPHLRQLIVQTKQATPEIASSLPRQLLSLTLSNVNSSAESVSSILQALPKGITSLFLGTHEPLTEADVRLLNPHLGATDLGMTEVQYEAIPLLPSTISSHIKVRASHPHLIDCSRLTSMTVASPQVLKTLPPNLRFLYIQLTFTQELIELIPKHLVKLHLAYMDLKDEDLVYLPRTLREFCVLNPNTSSTSTLNLTSMLPRQLESLSLPQCCIEGKKWFRDLPPTLLKLRMKQVSGISSGEIFSSLNYACPHLSTLELFFSEPLPAGQVAKLFALLPDKLTCLTIDFQVPHDYDPGLSNDDFALLPSGIISLHIPPSKRVNKRCCYSLPRHLQNFTIGRRERLWRFRKTRPKAQAPTSSASTATYQEAELKVLKAAWPAKTNWADHFQY